MKTTISLLFIFSLCVGCSQSAANNESPKISAAKPSQIPVASSNKQTSKPKKEQPKEDLTFMGKDCTKDCSGHEAGYEWAQEKDIDDIDDCGGKSQSFIEGCEAYVEEHESYYSDDNE